MRSQSIMRRAACLLILALLMLTCGSAEPYLEPAEAEEHPGQMAILTLRESQLKKSRASEPGLRQPVQPRCDSLYG